MVGLGPVQMEGAGSVLLSSFKGGPPTYAQHPQEQRHTSCPHAYKRRGWWGSGKKKKKKIKKAKGEVGMRWEVHSQGSGRCCDWHVSAWGPGGTWWGVFKSWSWHVEELVMYATSLGPEVLSRQTGSFRLFWLALMIYESLHLVFSFSLPVPTIPSTSDLLEMLG